MHWGLWAAASWPTIMLALVAAKYAAKRYLKASGEHWVCLGCHSLWNADCNSSGHRAISEEPAPTLNIVSGLGAVEIIFWPILLVLTALYYPLNFVGGSLDKLGERKKAQLELRKRLECLRLDALQAHKDEVEQALVQK